MFLIVFCLEYILQIQTGFGDLNDIVNIGIYKRKAYTNSPPAATAVLSIDQKQINIDQPLPWVIFG